MMLRPLMSDKLKSAVASGASVQSRPLSVGLSGTSSAIGAVAAAALNNKNGKRKRKGKNSIMSMFQGNAGIARRVAGGLRSRMAGRFDQPRKVN